MSSNKKLHGVYNDNLRKINADKLRRQMKWMRTKVYLGLAVLVVTLPITLPVYVVSQVVTKIANTI